MPRLPSVTQDRRDQLEKAAVAIASLASNPVIEPKLAAHVIDDVELRPLLETVVRRWTKLEKPRHISVAAAAGADRSELHLEHVVPCRVLVDRMIIDPAQCRDLLAEAVVLAVVTREEHKTLGGIFTHHRDLYAEMLKAPVPDLPALGRKRYRRSGIKLQTLRHAGTSRSMF